jgi:hypothetical protein
MDAAQAITRFANYALSPPRAARFSQMAASEKGRRKLLAGLDHDFENGIRSDAKSGAIDWRASCYAFHRSLDFGAAFPSVREAYDYLGDTDGWLIVLADGSAGIYRPESHWDAERVIVG